MKELDLLKKDWQKSGASFEQLSEKDIYAMIHKKSSSIVKWILIVSILEFVVLNGIGLLLNSERYEKLLLDNPFLDYLERFNYIIILGFIYLFYKNFKAISTLDSSKELIKDILKTRKIVNFYIVWNIIIGGISGFFSATRALDAKAFNDGFNIENPGKRVELISESSTIIGIITVVITMLGVFVFYKLLYGGFLRRLKNNYEELQKIES